MATIITISGELIILAAIGLGIFVFIGVNWTIIQQLPRWARVRRYKRAGRRLILLEQRQRERSEKAKELSRLFPGVWLFAWGMVITIEDWGVKRAWFTRWVGEMSHEAHLNKNELPSLTFEAVTKFKEELGHSDAMVQLLTPYLNVGI